jgi:hypothetical protein
VVQCDRDAAATVERVSSIRLDIRKGLRDDHIAVQAFARHRLAERERCETVADREAATWRASVVGGSVGYAMNAERAATSIDGIAVAIRTGREPA